MSTGLTIGFDADDTLWHNENIFEQVHARYFALLAQHHDTATVERTLFATEMRNLELYGYGIKGFTLSAIETALALTDGRIRPDEIGAILALGRDMLNHPVEPIEGVDEILASLRPHYRLLLITKGDLRDQERKVAKSGLAHRFDHIEIVSEKDPAAYDRILRRYAIDPRRFLMVGNSLKSDILPVLSLGGTGVHVPYRITWAHEHVAAPTDTDGRYFQIASLSELPPIIDRWGSDLASHRPSAA